MKALKESLDQKFLNRLLENVSNVGKVDKSILKKQLPQQDKWNSWELKKRTHWAAGFVNKNLSGDCEDKMLQLQKISPKFSGLQGVVFPTVIELYCTDYLEASCHTLEYITRFSTGEFAIRPFIEKYLKVWDWLYAWSKHENEHVRRLASEGCRPILPWGRRIEFLRINPDLIRPVLDELNDDPSQYVRKSVANNLNDISKDHPDKVKEWVQNWRSTENTKKIIHHGLRTLLRNGDPEAFQLAGFDTKNTVKGEVNCQFKEVKINEIQNFNAQIKNNSKKKTATLINLIVYYPRKNKAPLRKVFFWKKKTLQPGEKIELNKTITFQNLSTRKQYSGQHKIELQCNGKILMTQHFDLVNNL